MITIPFKLKKHETVMIQLLHGPEISVEIYNSFTDSSKHIGTFKSACEDLYWLIFKSSKTVFIGNGSGNIVSLKIKELVLNKDKEGMIKDIDLII